MWTRFLVGGSLLLGLLPLTGILIKRVDTSRWQRSHVRGAHANTSEIDESEEAGKLGHAVRIAALSLFAAFNFVIHPHGLVGWLVIGGVVVILLWEPATWLTAYLVRRSNGRRGPGLPT